jgi:hypothetical protein
MPFLEKCTLIESKPWPLPVWTVSLDTSSKKPHRWEQRRRNLEIRNPFGKDPLQKRAWSALVVYKFEKWRLQKPSKRARIRSPAQAKTQGLTFALPEHFLRGKNHNLLRYGMVPRPFDQKWLKGGNPIPPTRVTKGRKRRKERGSNSSHRTKSTT